MNLLVLPSGVIIAAGAYTETATTLTFADQVVPKSAVPGYQIINIAVPADFTPQTYTYNGGVLTKIPVPVPVPDTLNNYEFKYALLELGYMTGIQNRIAAIANATVKAKAQAALDGATFKRSSPLLNALATQAGLSQANIDNIFITGKGQEP